MELKPEITKEYLTTTSWLETLTLPEKLIPNEKEFKVLWDLHPEEHAEVMIFG